MGINILKPTVLLRLCWLHLPVPLPFCNCLVTVIYFLRVFTKLQNSVEFPNSASGQTVLSASQNSGGKVCRKWSVSCSAYCCSWIHTTTLLCALGKPPLKLLFSTLGFYIPEKVYTLSSLKEQSHILPDFNIHDLINQRGHRICQIMIKSPGHYWLLQPLEQQRRSQWLWLRHCLLELHQ